MFARLVRAPKAMVLLGFGLVFGMVWAAASGPGTAAAPPKGGVTSVTVGAGLTGSPNPITSTGTISAAFGGNGAATTLSRSDHHHDARYLQQTGGTLSGDLAFIGNAQIIAPRVENAAFGPPGAATGRLYFDTTELRLKLHDGVQWTPVPQIFSDQEIPEVRVPLPDVWQDLACFVTFTLPAEEAVFLDGGATGQLHNLISYGVIPPGIQTSNHLQMFLGASLDGGSPVQLAFWDQTFLTVGSSTRQPKSSAAMLLRLPAGSHTARLHVRTNGTLNPGATPLLPEAFEGRIQDAWVRVQRP